MNRIGKILKEKGIENITPSDEVLVRLKLTIQSWNKMVANKKDPEFYQVPAIAQFLGCEIEELFPNPKKPSASERHGLVNA